MGIAGKQRHCLTIVACVGMFVLGVENASANVSLKNGNFFIAYTDTDDYTVGSLDMQVERVYNSKTDFTGMFGEGWGADFEVNLRVQADGSLVVHEYGGGADNHFAPRDVPLRTQDTIVTEVMDAATKSGGFSSDDAKRKYESLLQGDYLEKQWEYYRERNLIAPLDLPVGERFFSGRFSTQIVTRTADGYRRDTPDGKTQLFDPSGHLVRAEDSNGNSVSYTYDANGHLTEIDNSKGDRLIFHVDANGFVESITEASGKTAQYGYSGKDLVHAVDVDGHVYDYTYDGRHNLVAVKVSGTPGGGTSYAIAYYPYDQLENVKSVKTSDGVLSQYKYFQTVRGGNSVQTAVVTTTGQDGAKSQQLDRYTYLGTTEPLQLHELYENTDGDWKDTIYDAAGYPLKITTADGWSAFAYDSLERVVMKQTPYEKVALQYDPETGKPSYVADTVGKKTTWSKFTYDSKGNVTHALDSDGHDLALTYDDKGQIASITSGAHIMTFAYDADGHPTVIAVTGLGSINVTYKANGDIKDVSSSAGPKVAAQVTTMFQELLNVVNRANVTFDN